MTWIGRGLVPNWFINVTEAARVREIFDLYLKHGSLLPVVQELERPKANQRGSDATARGGERGADSRISRLMALAIRFERMLRDGVVQDETDLGKLAHLTQPWMRQILNLLNLVQSIQEE